MTSKNLQHEAINAGHCTIRLLYISYTPPNALRDDIVVLQGQNNHILCGGMLRGQVRSRIFKDWRKKKKRHICVERKIGLIHRKAIYRSNCRVYYCKPLITGWNQASTCVSVFCFCMINAHKSGEPVQTKPSLCHRAVLKIFLPLHGDSFVPPCVTPSFPFHPSFSTQAESATLVSPPYPTPPSPVRPVSLCNGITTKFALVSRPHASPTESCPPSNDRARKRQGGREMNLKQPRWLKWKKKSQTKKKKKKFCSTEI